MADELWFERTNSHDETLGYIERAEIAIKKFNKLSSSEYVTSQNACDDIIKMKERKSIKEETSNNSSNRKDITNYICSSNKK